MDAGVFRQVRALYDRASLAVYQAYAPEIEEPALRSGTFVEPFGMGRMTWIRPSFLWMAYRLGWGTKPGQTRVLRVHLTRDGSSGHWGVGCFRNIRLGFMSPRRRGSSRWWGRRCGFNGIRSRR